MIGERIKELRKVLKITQQVFAEKIGLKRNTVASYEINVVFPSDRTITDICDKFGVSEQWLRTGEGEMLVPKDEKEEIAEFFGRVLAGKEEIKEIFINAIAHTSEEDLKKMADFMVKFAAEYEKNKKN